MTICVNVDGRLGSAEERSLSPLDQGFLFGASVYETIRTYEGVPFLPSRHFKRLRESAEALGIEIDTSDDELRRRLYETLDSAGNEESSIRIVVTGPAPRRRRRSSSSCARCRLTRRACIERAPSLRSCRSCAPRPAE
jgi:branched-subunit amino acid aminotransferase/4-amino-4-deoxychorismate lyase